MVEQLDNLQEATLHILENTGVQFPSEKALAIFAEHGAHVDHDTQIVKIPRDLVFKAMKRVPRYFTLGARNPEFDLQLQDGVSFFTNDGCGHKVVDFKTGENASFKQGRCGHDGPYKRLLIFDGL